MSGNTLVSGGVSARACRQWWHVPECLRWSCCAIQVLVLMLLFSVFPAGAQILRTDRAVNLSDSLRDEFDKGPYFTLYRDNYFVVGTDPVHRPTADNSDIRFQVSIAQKLTKSRLPGGTYLFLAYTQTVAWDVFKESMPMHDFTFNPGVGIGKPLFSKGRFVGKATLMLEHMSNGRDSINSRSWNRVALGATIMIDEHLTVDGKIWVPIVDGQNNRDILKYVGLYQSGLTYMSRNRKFGCSVHIVKRATWRLDFNTQVDLFWRPWERANQYFFLQWYNGYGETLLDYDKFHNRVRVGIVIKPRFFSEY